MISLEAELKRYMTEGEIAFRDNTNSTVDPDFTLILDTPDFKFDAKEKRQKYNMSNWTDEIVEEDCFIVDELSVRKAIYYSPNSGLLIRDNMRELYFFYNCADLVCMPRIRANRKINYNTESLKGKWIIDLRHAYCATNLNGIFSRIYKYMENIPYIFLKKTECYGTFIDETLDIKGTVRTSYYKNVDYSATR